MIDTRRPTLPLVLLFLVLCMFSAIAVVIAVARRAEKPVPVHTYNGVTWLGDECYIDDYGTLWCGMEQT